MAIKDDNDRQHKVFSTGGLLFDLGIKLSAVFEEVRIRASGRKPSLLQKEG